MSTSAEFSRNGLEVAIIGMAGRFPGAKNIEEFWQNLQNGVESIASFTDEELISSGIDSAMLNDPQYVKSSAVLEDVELFDASFFGFNPREAEIIDPQQRLFLECAWEALESAGYDSKNYQGLVGVYAGAGSNSYVFNLYSNENIRNSIDDFQLFLASDKDFLTTRVSYKLDLEGPSIDIQTACSTSLVAVHLACRSLLSGECDIALAGGVALGSSRKAGYLYKEGGISSPDGHCRAFDAEARGTVGGEGVGIVVLKRLEDALADGDRIHAVIKGSAINNDGALKVSYTAPRIDTQAKVIKAAQTIAEVDAQTITYIEAHGTATSLGDPIEIAALTQAFHADTQKTSFCAIGSLKTNIGHLDTAAGVAGLIKTVLALKHKQIPPSLHFKQPNPQIDFENSPFYVNTTLSEWKANGTPRRAGVSSFGIGGTNAHVILEEAPSVEPSSPSRPWQLLLLSAKTDSALETATANLVTHLKQHPDLNLADVAYTLEVGRRAFDHRLMVVCQSFDDAVTILDTKDPQRIFTHFQEPCNQQVVFMFPGQGSQYVNMGRELYETESVFRKYIDKCCEILKSHLGINLCTILYPIEEHSQAAEQLQQTHITQPALFVIEYALAQLWMAWGISPTAMIGHSIGEYVAACLAGVFSLEDALALVAARGRLMQQLPTGAMLSVPLSEEEIEPWLNEELTLAGINAPSLCVMSGSEEAIANLQSRLTQQGVECRRLYTSHAFHSQMMDSILEPFTKQVEKVHLNPPQIPFISNLTGTWITAEQAINPSYWAKHLRQTVHFAAGIAELIEESEQILLEVGPGRTLSTFAKQQTNESTVLTSMRHPQDAQSDVAFLLNTIGRLWLAGVQIDWNGYYATEQRHRIPLPTYPFERQRYWIEAQPEAFSVKTPEKLLHRKPNIADWFYIPSWERDIPAENVDNQRQTVQKSCWIIFTDTCGLGSQITKQLEHEGQDFITVNVGEQFTKVNSHTYVINPRKRDDYDALLQELRLQDLTPQTITHLWGITSNTQLHKDTLNEHTQSAILNFETSQILGFYSLLFLAQAFSKQNITTPIQITVVTNNMQEVVGDEKIYPEKATVLGSCMVIPQEYPNITCQSIDILIPELGTWQADKLATQLIAEVKTLPSHLMIAYRGGHRWVQTFKAIHLDETIKEKTRLRQEGVYLIAGDLIEGLGLNLAEYLAQTLQAKLILIGTLNLPEKNEWSQWLATHDDRDNISREINKLQALEASGLECLMIKADVTDEDQMQAAINQAYDRFGVIDGVFYVPEIDASQSAFSVQEISQDDCDRQFESKVYRLFVLDKVLRGRDIDFCLVQSSLSTILGGLGLVAYSASYQFIDAFVHQKNQTDSVPWFSINRQALHSDSEREQTTPSEVASAELAMIPKEVWKSFELVLSMSSGGQIVVSTGDLKIRLNQAIKLKPLTQSSDSKQLQQENSFSTHLRPSLQTVYVAPSNEIERTIANIWQELLGVEQIGIHDNFFELGGHSLLAVQVTSRLREIFQAEVPLQSILFDAPTVAGLAAVITEIQPKQDELQQMAALLQQVRNLSPEEIQQELVKES